MASVKKRRWTHRGETKEAWVLRYTDNDRKRRMETFKSKKAADERRKVIEQEIDMGIHTAKRETVTVEEALDAWLRDGARFLSIEQVAGIIQLSTKQIRRIIKRGELAHHRIGRLYRISPADLDYFLAQRRKGP